MAITQGIVWLALLLWLAACEAQQPPCSALIVIGSVSFDCTHDLLARGAK